MVNGIVDPLQVGAFARSIASIASQLGLPLWLVELRHAGTHEDLPSLDLLRRGVAEVNNQINNQSDIELDKPLRTGIAVDRA
jgi:ribosomal biogenesis protein LAS1